MTSADLLFNVQPWSHRKRPYQNFARKKVAQPGFAAKKLQNLKAQTQLSTSQIWAWDQQILRYWTKTQCWELWTWGRAICRTLPIFDKNQRQTRTINLPNINMPNSSSQAQVIMQWNRYNGSANSKIHKIYVEKSKF